MRDGEGEQHCEKEALGEVQHWVRRGQERRAADTAAAEEKATKELTRAVKRRDNRRGTTMCSRGVLHILHTLSQQQAATRGPGHSLWRGHQKNSGTMLPPRGLWAVIRMSPWRPTPSALCGHRVRASYASSPKQAASALAAAATLLCKQCHPMHPE